LAVPWNTKRNTFPRDDGVDYFHYFQLGCALCTHTDQWYQQGQEPVPMLRGQVIAFYRMLWMRLNGYRQEP